MIDQQALAEVTTSLSPAAKECLLWLEDEHSYVIGPRHVNSLPLKEARAGMKELRWEGCVLYGPGWDDDRGLVIGSGYWMTPFGKAVRRAVHPQYLGLD